MKRKRSLNFAKETERAFQMFQADNLNDAQVILKKILRISPTNSEALNLLGTIYAKKGELDLAIDVMIKLVKLNPSQPNCYFNLATAYQAKQEFNKSINLFQQYLDLVPQDLDALCNIARIFYDSGNYEKSVYYYEEAVSVAPSRVDLLNAMGLAYCKLKNYDAAISCYKRALGFQPNDHIVLTNLGISLHELFKAIEATVSAHKALSIKNEALISFQKALKIKPDYSIALLNLGYLHRMSGMLDDAIDCFQKLTCFEPENAWPYFYLAEIFEKRGDLEKVFSNLSKAAEYGVNHDKCLIIKARALYRQGEIEQAIAHLTSIENTDNNNLNELINKHFLLGKCYVRLKQTNEAFKNFQEGNLLQATTVDVKKMYGEKYIQSIEENKKVFTAQWVQGWKEYPYEEDPPLVFLVGFPRSGTTLLDQMLDSHSQINVIEEKPLFRGVIDFINLKFGLYPEILAELDSEQLKSIRSEYFNLMGQYSHDNATENIIIDKLPLNIVRIGLIQRIFPSSKIILAMRHPFDVCLSNFMQYYSTNNAMENFLTLDGTALLYTKVMDLWFQYEKIFDLDFHVVKYENIVENPGYETEKLTKFIGVEWEEAILDYFKHSRERTLINTPSYQDVMQPIYKRAKFRWKLYANQLESVIPILKPYAKAFGYETE